MPPPPTTLSLCSGLTVCLFLVTSLLLSVSLATLEGSKVALAMPPPATVAALLVT
jgi:hypothetical protein